MEKRSKTIEELEGTKWDPPDDDSSNLVATCHRLRKVPIELLSIENLRMLIGQDIGTKYLVPIALDYLMQNPWAEGDFFEGDLLLNVLRLSSKNSSYWTDHQDQLFVLIEIMDSLQQRMDLFEKELLPLWKKMNQ